MEDRDTEDQEKGEEKRKLTRPYSHSDLGFRRWDNQLARDAGCCLGLDFGGTLSKVVFFQPEEMPTFANKIAKFLLSTKSYGSSGVRDQHLEFFSEKLGGTLHFLNFETSHTQGAIKLLEGVDHHIRRVHATGGGAFKYSKEVKTRLGIKLMKQDELETVVRGVIFTLLEHPDSECYTYEPVIEDQNASNDTSRKRHHGISHVDALSYEMEKVPHPMPVSSSSFFPLLIVNIGSGVSVINVTSPTTFKRVSGTAIGGATYYGLCKLLCRCDTFDEAMDLAELGDSRDVNLTVQDIYGGSYEQAGLSGEVTASFFGKAASTVGTVRTKRSRKRPYVSVLEKIGLVLIALLSVNLLSNMRSAEQILAMNVFEISREIILILMPAGITYLVFWSTEAKLASSHPHAGNVSPSARSAEAYKAKGANSPPNTACFEEADIARALVIMVAQNVTQIAFLNARLYNSKRVLFTGNFLRHNRIALRALSSMMHNWSQGQIKALFMEHEGYFGAVGTFLYSCGVTPDGEEEDYSSCNTGSLHATRAQDTGFSTGESSASSDEEENVVEDLLFKGEFPRRRSKASVLAK